METQKQLLDIFAGSPADTSTLRNGDMLHRLAYRFRDSRESMHNAIWRVGGRLSFPLAVIEREAAQY